MTGQGRLLDWPAVSIGRGPRGSLTNAMLDRWIAGGAVGLLGVGAVLALAGVGSQSVPLAVTGGAFAGAALLVLMGAGWVDALVLLAISSPLPTLWAAGEDVRVATATAVAGLVLVSWVLRRPVEARPLDASGLPLRVIAGLVLLLVAASVASPSPTIAVRELVNMLVLLALLVVVTDRMRAEPGARPRVATTLAVLATGCGVLAVLEAVGVLPGAFPRIGTSFNRATLGFGQPNALGLFLAVTLPFVAWRAAHAEGGARLFWRGALACAAAGLLATFSRGNWLAVVVGALVFVLAGQWRTTVKVLVGTVVAAVVFDLGSGGLIRDTFERTLGDWVVEQRLGLMLTGLLMFRDHPLLGVGPGGFESQVEQYGFLVPDLLDFQPTPHNAYVQMAAETGFAGPILYVALLVGLFRGVGARVRVETSAQGLTLERAVLWSLGAVVISGLFMWPLAHGAGEAVILVLALAATSAQPPRPSPS
jgi:O-antigen ligase